MQYFKGDELEQKFYEVGSQIMTTLSNEKTSFFNESYDCFSLGQIIWENRFSPLANAIPENVFRESFFALFDSFSFAGSFEGYIDVFKKVFGDDAVIEFAVPAPGKLEIDIVATGIVLTEFIARSIVDGGYVFDEVIDYDGDIIVFQSFKGLESQYELERMLFEMVPDGIYTEITLTIGS